MAHSSLHLQYRRHFLILCALVSLVLVLVFAVAAVLYSRGGFDLTVFLLDELSRFGATEALEKAQGRLDQMQFLRLTLFPLLGLTIVVLLVGATWMANYYANKLAKPISKLAKTSHDMASGHYEGDFRLSDQEHPGELIELSHALDMMCSELRNSHEKIRALAYNDPLTGLPNRRMLQEFLSEQIEHAEASTLAMLLIDMDDFKQINDTAGHETGDGLLCAFANRISGCVEQRYTPTGSKSLLARLGGDEFVVVVPEITDEHDAEHVADRIIKAIQAPFHVFGREYRITSSIGIAFSPRDGSDLSSLLKHADTAMYKAKQLGKSQAVCFEPSMNTELQARVKLIADIRIALEQDHLFLVYQPVWDLNRDQIIGAEVLLRWMHPQRGLISPGEFIPVIEETELIAPVTEWVINRACQEASQLQFRPQPFKIAVNFSGHLLGEQSSVEMIQRALASSKLQPQLLTVEVTETAMMEDVTCTMEILQQVRDLGVQIWVDDFGTGYSSLSYLQKLPLNGLKIDRSFVMELGENEQAADLVGGIISLAHSLQLKTVAEGIETDEQRALLEALNSDFGQGFLMAKPLPFAQLVTLLEQRFPSVDPEPETQMN